MKGALYYFAVIDIWTHQSREVDDSESKHSKTKAHTKPKKTSCLGLYLERDSVVLYVPLPTLTTATSSAKGSSLTTTATTATTASAAVAATSEIPFYIPLLFAVAVPHLLSSEDEMRGKGDMMRGVEAGTIYLI